MAWSICNVDQNLEISKTNARCLQQINEFTFIVECLQESCVSAHFSPPIISSAVSPPTPAGVPMAVTNV